MVVEAYHEYLKTVNIKNADIDIQSIFLHGSVDHLHVHVHKLRIKLINFLGSFTPTCTCCTWKHLCNIKHVFLLRKFTCNYECLNTYTCTCTSFSFHTYTCTCTCTVHVLYMHNVHVLYMYNVHVQYMYNVHVLYMYSSSICIHNMPSCNLTIKKLPKTIKERILHKNIRTTIN